MQLLGEGCWSVSIRKQLVNARARVAKGFATGSPSLNPKEFGQNEVDSR